MATAGVNQLREKTDQELLEQMALEKKRIFDATVRGASGEAIKPHEKREGRLLIARIQTILRERALRVRWDKEIARQTPKSEGAGAAAKKLAAREPRPQAGPVKLPKQARKALQGPADRAALRLAEARRRRICLVREDAGETR